MIESAVVSSAVLDIRPGVNIWIFISTGPEVIFHTRSSFCSTHRLFDIVPAICISKVIPVRHIGVSHMCLWTLPSAPYRTGGPTKLIFGKPDVGAFTAENVLQPGPSTLILISWPYKARLEVSWPHRAPLIVGVSNMLMMCMSHEDCWIEELAGI